MSGAAGRAAPAGGAKTGYALVVGAYLAMGMIGALVRWADAPESALVVLRMAIAGLILGALFARRPMLVEIRQPGVGWRLLLNGLGSATALWIFFIALRLTDAAIGMFLLFMAPVYVALAAPRLFGQKPDRVVYPALAIALAGMATILVPSLSGARDFSTLGIACGVGAGLLFAFYQLMTKSLTRKVRSVTIVLAELVCDVVFLLPIALWQTVGAGRSLTWRDWVAALTLALVCTVFGYTALVEGLRRVRVEHASILGYLEPVTAPLYALLLLGEAPAATTIAGGVLIVAAGMLVVVLGRPEQAALEAPL